MNKVFLHKKKLFLVLLLLIIFLSQCHLNQFKADDVLESAEKLIEDRPDSVVYLLETRIYPKELNKDQLNKYTLLLIQAKDKDDRNITNDTLIFKAKDYFVSKKDWRRAALSSFYSGHLYASQGYNKKAILSYLDAETYAKEIDDNSLRGLIEFYIGDLYYEQLIKDDAIIRYKISASYFNKAQRYKNEIIAYNKIGSTFLLKGDVDSSFFYYNKSLSLAEAEKDSLEIAYLLQNTSLVYDQIGDVENANKLFRKSLSFISQEKGKSKLYLNLALYFKNRQEQDSTLYYLNKSLETMSDEKDHALKSVIYSNLSDIKAKEQNYKESLHFYKLHANEIRKKMQDINDQALMDAQRRYDFELIQNENNKLLIEKQSAFLLALTLLILILIMSFIFYRKNIKNKAAIVDAENKVYHLKDVVDNYDEKEDSFKKVLFQHFDIFKKVALLESHLKEDEKKQGQKLLKKVNDIVYNKNSLDWEMLYDTMNKLYRGFPDTLRSKCPQLDESEIRVYCLTYAGLLNSEIALILGLSVNTIQMKKSSIRKKLGIEGYGNIIEFFDKNIKEKP